MSLRLPLRLLLMLMLFLPRLRLLLLLLLLLWFLLLLMLLLLFLPRSFFSFFSFHPHSAVRQRPLSAKQKVVAVAGFAFVIAGRGFTRGEPLVAEKPPRSATAV